MISHGHASYFSSPNNFNIMPLKTFVTSSSPMASETFVPSSISWPQIIKSHCQRNTYQCSSTRYKIVTWCCTIYSSHGAAAPPEWRTTFGVEVATSPQTQTHMESHFQFNMDSCMTSTQQHIGGTKTSQACAATWPRASSYSVWTTSTSAIGGTSAGTSGSASPAPWHKQMASCPHHLCPICPKFLPSQKNILQSSFI